MSTFGVVVFLLVFSIIRIEAQVYKASILKYNAPMQNVEKYVKTLYNEIHEASIQKVDILVYISELNIMQSSDLLVIGKEIVPCDWKNQELLKHLSCAAKNSQVYIVTKAHEKSFFSAPSTSTIVINRDGKIISKFLHEENNNKIETFSTDFNVTFGHILHANLYDFSIYLSKPKNLNDFIVWTNSMSEKPRSSACIDDESWIHGRDLNIISAESYYPISENCKICNGKYDIKNQHINKTEEIELIIAILNKQWCTDTKKTSTADCSKLEKDDFNEIYAPIDYIRGYVLNKLQIISFLVAIYILEML